MATRAFSSKNPKIDRENAACNAMLGTSLVYNAARAKSGSENGFSTLNVAKFFMLPCRQPWDPSRVSMIIVKYARLEVREKLPLVRRETTWSVRGVLLQCACSWQRFFRPSHALKWPPSCSIQVTYDIQKNVDLSKSSGCQIVKWRPCWYCW